MVKKVRILKNGKHNGFYYKKGEIYEITDNIDSRTVYLKVVHNKDVLVTVYNSSSYGQEAEIIEEAEQSIYELW